MLALDPVYTVGRQIIEAIRRHERISAAEARKRALELFERVRIPSPERRLDAYPHEMSGGMRQRAMIALALACRPQHAARRRADHRARCHRADPDPAAAARAAARARSVDDLRHARHRRGGRGRGPHRRDVRGAHRRDRQRARRHPLAAPSLHDRPPVDARPRRPTHGAAPARHPRQPAGPRQPASGLRLRTSVLARRRSLPVHGARGCGARRGASRALPAHRRYRGGGGRHPCWSPSTGSDPCASASSIPTPPPA